MSFPLFLVPILAGLIAQSLKPLLNHRWYSEMETAGHKLPRYGGMPSAHSSFVFSLATLTGLVDSFHSISFALAFALLILVLDDALRMRIFLSRQGEALHRLVAKLPETERSAYPYIETRLGHKLREVIAGGAIGVVVTVLVLWVL